MPATDLERLIVQIEANTTKLTKDLAKLTGDVNTAARTVEARTQKMSSTVTAAFTRAGAAVTALFSVQAILRFAQATIKTADELQALSDRTGISTENIQKLQHVAARSNVDIEQLNGSLDFLSKTLGQAALGQGKLAETFKRLDLKPSRDLLETYLITADAVQKAKTRTEEYAIAQAAFGKSSAELVGMLRQGPQAIKEQMDAFKDGISPETVEDLADFEDEFRELTISFTNMAAGPLADVTAGFLDFVHVMQGSADAPWWDNWLTRLQLLSAYATSNFFEISRLTALMKANEKQKNPTLFTRDDRIALRNAHAELETVTHRVIAMQKSINDVGFQFFSQEDLDLQIARMTKLTDEVHRLEILKPKKIEKPSGDEDAEIAAKQVAETVARTLATLRDAEAKLAEARSSANAEALRGTDAYYDKLIEGINISTDAAIKSVEAKKKADIDALDEKKRSAEAIANIEKTATADILTLNVKREEQLSQIDRERAQRAQEQAAKIREAESELAVATAETNVERLKNTDEFYAAQRTLLRVNLDKALDALDSEKEARIAAITTAKSDQEAYAAEVAKIEQDIANKKAVIRENDRKDQIRTNNDELADERQKAADIIALHQQRADSIKQIREDELDSARDLSRTRTETTVLQTKTTGTPVSEQFDAQRKAIDKNLQLQKDALDEAEQARIDAFLRTVPQVEELETGLGKIHETFLNRRMEADEKAAQDRIQLEEDEKTQRLTAVSNYFGQLATLQSSSNSTLAAIGKAAAIVQATIDGYLAVQKVFAEIPPPFNVPAAAVMAGLVAMNVAKIAAMEKGGIVGPDGPIPLRHYSRGGVASSPQVAVFGEGAKNEAYVPLPDGQRIPVMFRKKMEDALGPDEAYVPLPGGRRIPVSIKRYARGGIASSPQLAMFGEGSQNEAFVPLPDGRRIPVALRTPTIAPGTASAQQSLNQNFSIDARGAQRGVGEEIEEKLRAFAPHIAAASVAIVNKRLPDMMKRARSRKL